MIAFGLTTPELRSGDENPRLGEARDLSRRRLILNEMPVDRMTAMASGANAMPATTWAADLKASRLLDAEADSDKVGAEQ